MIRRFFISCLSIVMIFMASLSLSSCGTEISSPHILTDLYNGGELTKKDIENIAALRVGYVAIVKSKEQREEDYQRINFKPTSPAPLEDTVKDKMEQDFRAKIDGELFSFEIVGYYGKYSDYYIIEVSYEVEGADYTPAVYPLITANVFLGYIGPPNEIYVWQDN